ncbi:hypothetical protein SBRY_100006 [Actinacidiphila bryophytorum]|uniref:Uncharacterized protein n=1 Tax=Actinacidiphila bryophytorum TaxID=1436133 RepID=A0A9W4GXQ0_9ACTN|nr:hypothetical protein SBRY_100006 [Actinacidiphila bryophytorum]
MERQLQRDRHQRPVGALPRRDRCEHRQRGAGRAVDLQRRQQPAVDPGIGLRALTRGRPDPSGRPRTRSGGGTVAAAGRGLV